MSIRLSARDLKVLAKCAAAKWLTTSQLRRLYFSNVTADAACKSLRRLAQAGYLASFREHRMAEALHAVGRKGKALLAARGLEVELQRTPPRQLEHLVGINDIRVSLETSPVRLSYFFACWELGRLGWPHPVIPDGIFELAGAPPRRFTLEFDRGTEPFEVLQRKLFSYQAGLSAFVPRAVILVTETEGRLRTIQRRLRTHRPQLPILGASLGDIRAAGIYASVFRDVSNEALLSLTTFN